MLSSEGYIAIFDFGVCIMNMDALENSASHKSAAGESIEQVEVPILLLYSQAFEALWYRSYW